MCICVVKMHRGKQTPYMSTSRSVYAKMRAGYRSALRPTFKKRSFVSVAAVVRSRGARGETKAVDIPEAVLNLPFTAANSNSQSLTLVQEGASFYNRIGRKICMKSLQLTAMIYPTNAVGALAQETLRYIIFYDKQPNGAAATWNNVIQAYDNAGGVTNAVADGINMDNRDRFVILRDRKIVQSRTSAAGIQTGPPFGSSEGSVGTDGSDGGSVIKEFIRLQGYEANFNGTANPATVAQIATGNLGIVLQGGTGSQYSLIGSARLRFTDF